MILHSTKIHRKPTRKVVYLYISGFFLAGNLGDDSRSQGFALPSANAMAPWSYETSVSMARAQGDEPVLACDGTLFDESSRAEAFSAAPAVRPVDGLPIDVRTGSMATGSMATGSMPTGSMGGCVTRIGARRIRRRLHASSEPVVMPGPTPSVLWSAPIHAAEDPFARDACVQETHAYEGAFTGQFAKPVTPSTVRREKPNLSYFSSDDDDFDDDFFEAVDAFVESHEAAKRPTAVACPGPMTAACSRPLSQLSSQPLSLPSSGWADATTVQTSHGDRLGVEHTFPQRVPQRVPTSDGFYAENTRAENTRAENTRAENTCPQRGTDRIPASQVTKSQHMSIRKALPPTREPLMATAQIAPATSAANSRPVIPEPASLRPVSFPGCVPTARGEQLHQLSASPRIDGGAPSRHGCASATPGGRSAARRPVMSASDHVELVPSSVTPLGPSIATVASEILGGAETWLGELLRPHQREGVSWMYRTLVYGVSVPAQQARMHGAILASFARTAAPPPPPPPQIAPIQPHRRDSC